MTEKAPKVDTLQFVIHDPKAPAKLHGLVIVATITRDKGKGRLEFRLDKEDDFTLEEEDYLKTFINELMTRLKAQLRLQGGPDAANFIGEAQHATDPESVRKRVESRHGQRNTALQNESQAPAGRDETSGGNSLEGHPRGDHELGGRQGD